MKYLNFIDLNGNHNAKFKFRVRVTWDKYNDPEYILWNIQEVIAKDHNDAEIMAKDKFLIEIMGTADKSQKKFLTAYIFDYLNAPMVEVINFPRNEKELNEFNKIYADYPAIPDKEKIDPYLLITKS